MSDATRRDVVGTVAVSRSDLLKRVERWTPACKIRLCRGLCAEVVIASEVIRVHGLSFDEIDCWMEAYKKKDFEALKVGYRRKRTAP